MERLTIKTSQLLLASYLAQYYPVEYADFELSIGRPNTASQKKRYERKVKDLLENRRFDVLAISCWTSLSYQATMKTARICRELYPNKLIVVGGYHPSACPEEFLTDDQVIDYVIGGEGELALKEIVGEFAKQGRPKRTIVINRGATFPAEEFVHCDWSLTQSLVSRELGNKISSIYLYLSRGCPFSCSFCMEPLKDHQWRAYAPAAAVAVLQETVEHFRPYSIAISDACFGMRPSWRKDFLRRLREWNPSLWFIFETRPEYLDEEDIKLLADLKIEVQFGIESCAHDMLLLMKKSKRPDRFLEIFDRTSESLSQHRILHRANLIFNHPGETKRTLEETFAHIDRLLLWQDSYLMWACHGYMHFPGCELDYNRSFYEQEFGSRFISARWWHEDQDQYENSQRFIPSRDLENDVDLWRRLLERRSEAMKQTLAPPAFRFAAQKYFEVWKRDYRYGKD